MEDVGRRHLGQQLAGAEQMLLANQLIKGARAHPLRQRLAARRLGGKQAGLLLRLARAHC